MLISNHIFIPGFTGMSASEIMEEGAQKVQLANYRNT